MGDSPINLKVQVSSATLEYDKKSLKAILRAAGNEIARLTRSKIKSAAGSGVVYRGPGGSAAKYRGGYKKGRYQASSAGQAPVSVTGTLAKSIKVSVFKSGEGVSVRENAFYALFLQAGARGGGRKRRNGVAIRGKSGIGKSRVLEARPSLTAALDEREDSIAERIEEAVTQGIKFRVKRP